MTTMMSKEIERQGDAWRAALAEADRTAASVRELLGLAGPDPSSPLSVRFLGAGSSYYLGLSAAHVWRGVGLRAEAVPASEPLLHAPAYPWEGVAAIAVSRSGATTETLAALRAAAAAGAPTIVVTTVADAPMAAEADVALVLRDAAEEATVQTRSFSGQLLASLLLGLHAGGDLAAVDAARTLPGLARDAIDHARSVVDRVGTDWSRAYFLGSGANAGLAREGALKLKEAALVEAEAFHTLEFRHGPMSMVDGETLLVAILGDDRHGHEAQVVREMRALGARVLVVADRDVEVEGAVSCVLPGGLPASVRLPLALPTLHWLAHAKAIAKGIDPDHPRHLSFAVELEGL